MFEKPKKTKLVGKSRAVKKVKSQCEQAAKSGCSVLILGLSGTGKELVAGLVGAANGRESERFLTVNCAAIPDNLIESTLFGHVRGAFTGATEEKAGVFEQANGGTLFLDEIADLSLAAQAKVLRVLEYGDVIKVGSGKTIHVDVHIIAATNKDMQMEIAEGRFRADLYYRLARAVIKIPPLCERLEDVPLIAKYYLKQKKQNYRLTRSALKKMYSYSWPGNVRELINVLSQASISLPTHRKTIQAKDIPITEDVEFSQVSAPVSKEKVEIIIRLLDEHEKISNSDVQKALSISSTAAGKWLKRMEGTILQRHSSGKGTYYTGLKKTPEKHEVADLSTSNNLSDRQSGFIAGLQSTGKTDFSRCDYEMITSVSSRTANRDLSDLIDMGFLRVSGKGKKAHYFLKNGANEVVGKWDGANRGKYGANRAGCGVNQNGCGANDMARV